MTTRRSVLQRRLNLKHHQSQQSANNHNLTVNKKKQNDNKKSRKHKAIRYNQSRSKLTSWSLIGLKTLWQTMKTAVRKERN